MIKIFKHLNKTEWLIFAISVVFIVAQVWLELTVPGYMKEITQLVQTQGSEMKDILLAGLYMLLCTLGSLVCAVVIAILSAKIASTFSSRLRGKIFNKVQGFSMAEINKFSTASLITRSTNDITQIQTFIVMGLFMMIKAPVTAVWAICKIANNSWQWTTATAVAVGVLLVSICVIMFLVIPKFAKIQKQTDDVNRISREQLSGIRVVRAYNAENFQEEKFENANNSLTKTNLFVGKVMASIGPIMTFVLSGLSLAIYWLGAYIIQDASGLEKIGLFSDMVVFSSYAVQVIMAFMMLAIVFILFPRAMVSAKRVNEVLDTENSIIDGNITCGKKGVKGEIEFKNVCFKYPDAQNDVLQNISFKIKKGQTVAFIGATGCGKSSIINLIPRFYDATQGEILVDGINVKDYVQTDLRSKIGYVSQKAIIFGGTIKSNIEFGEDAENLEDSELDQALKISEALEFVKKLEKQDESEVSQGGTNLSGGQKQRLSIARAVAKKPEIFIFDDSFSALDYKTDKKVRKQLKSELSGATSIIVAQRIGTIKDADQIFVLEDGKIVGSGTHKELLKTCKTYKEIALSQLSKEEL